MLMCTFTKLILNFRVMSTIQVRFIDKDKDKTVFFATLRKRVDGYFKENNISKHYNAAMVTKTVVLLLAYIVPFAALLAFTPSYGISLVLWTIMGFSLAGIGMSVMSIHDAFQFSYHKDKKWFGESQTILFNLKFC